MVVRFCEPTHCKPGFQVFAPFTGEVLSLTQHPEHRISSGVLGEGVLIKLAGAKLCAPFDGYLQAHSADMCRLQLVSKSGLKLLLDFGTEPQQPYLYPVKNPLRSGRHFVRGETLGTLDLLALQRHNPLTLCSVLLTNAEKLDQVAVTQRRVDSGETPLFTVTAARG